MYFRRKNFLPVASTFLYRWKYIPIKQNVDTIPSIDPIFYRKHDLLGKAFLFKLKSNSALSYRR